MVEAGREYAAAGRIDGIVALGGGSSLDCAKGINFVLTNGGSMRDYRGHGKAAKPMLPSIGVPTTAGTGSEAQSYALISDARDPRQDGVRRREGGVPHRDSRSGADACRSPRGVTAIAGYDAISHAVESYVTARRTPRVGRCFAREAWRLLEANYERVLGDAARRRRPRRDAAAARTTPAWRSRRRCSARRTPAPIR